MSTSSRNNRRLNLRLNADLIAWTVSYCERNGTTVSGLVRMLLVQLRELEDVARQKALDMEHT